MIALCEANGITLKLGDFPLEAAQQADEAFVTGTFGGITPVNAIDGYGIKPLGPVTREIRSLYEALKDAEPPRA